MIDPNLIGLAMNIIRMVLTNELVVRWLDNWTAGTQNKIDDMVWLAVKQVLGMNLEPIYAKAELEKKLHDIQLAYNNMSPEELREAKTPRKVWESDVEGRMVFVA